MIAADTHVEQEVTGWESLFHVGLISGIQRIILTGNIQDLYWHRNRAVPLAEWCAGHLVEEIGYATVLQYDLASGLCTLRGEEPAHPRGQEAAEQRQAGPDRPLEGRSSGPWTTPESAGRPQPAPSRVRPDRSIDADLSELLRILNRTEAPTALLIRDTEALVAHDRLHTEADRRHAILVRRLSEEAARNLRSSTGQRLHNAVLLFYAQEGLIPAGLHQDDPNAWVIHVALPSFEERLEFFRREQATFYQGTGVPSEPGSPASPEQWARLTDGCRLKELYQLAMLSQGERIPLERFDELLLLFRHGRKYDYWKAVTSQDLQGLFASLTGGRDGRGIRGQDEAIEEVCKAIYRGKAGIPRLIGRCPTRPRVVLFFVGPTGVGKTLSARRLSRFLFGKEEDCVVFDMSEYRLEHNVARLIGSPPGFVGFEAGGQLTNKVRDRVFLVLLFDEIEKAHPLVLDSFLQILDRGCLTDGKGETVYFSECVIIFTSNIGAAEAEGTPFHSRKDLKRHFRRAVKSHFVDRLGRPELLGRIGLGNIVVFNPITDPEVKRGIVADELEALMAALAHQYPGFSFRYTPTVLDYFQSGQQFDELGARGLTGALEHTVGTEMARCVNSNPPGSFLLTVEGGSIVLQEE